MLGGVPCREVKEQKDQLDRLHDAFFTNIYIVSKGKEKHAFKMIDLVVEFLRAAHDNKVSEIYKDVDVKYVDSKTAEVLYGVKRRYKEKSDD